METNKNGSIQVVTQDALATIIKSEVDTQISTAKSYPRSLKEFHDKALTMATFNEEIASLCSYSLPRAGKEIEGASVRLAEIVCSSYGNIRAGARVIANDGKTITAQGICHDLESNNCITVEVKRRITDKHGRTYNEDMQVVAGNAACAIAFRNAVFKVIPFALVQDIYDRAKEVARGTAETLVKRRTKAIEYFHQLGVKDEQICAALEIKNVDDIDLEKLSTLSGMRAAIKNGEATVQSLFEEQKENISQEELRILLVSNGAKLPEKERKRIIDIIEKNEVTSFKKVKEILATSSK